MKDVWKAKGKYFYEKAPANQCEKIKLCSFGAGPNGRAGKSYGLTIYRTNIRMAYKMQEWSASSRWLENIILGKQNAY